MLVHWPGEDSTTVVLEKNLLLSEEKLCRGSDVGDECVIKHIPTHKGKVHSSNRYVHRGLCVCGVCMRCVHAFKILILVLFIIIDQDPRMKWRS